MWDVRCAGLLVLVAFGEGWANEPGFEELTLADVAAGRAEIVDLAYPLNERAQFWPGDDYRPFELRTIATIEANGVLSKEMRLPEHVGTHLDAPNHFERNQRDVAAIPPGDLFAPGVVIDVSKQAEADPDYGLSVADVRAWETAHGRIPDGAVVLLRTGWSRFWDNTARYRNRDARGTLHFPSFTGPAAEFLVAERKIRGLGVDNLSIDRGVSQDFAVHHVVNKAGRYGLENVAHLDRLPPRGFWLVVAPMKIEQGSGGPTRLFAILPRRNGQREE